MNDSCVSVAGNDQERDSLLTPMPRQRRLSSYAYPGTPGGDPEGHEGTEFDEDKTEWVAGDGRDRPLKKGYTPRKKRVWTRSDPNEDLCRIKWEPDPDEPPADYMNGHIPDQAMMKIFELWSEDPVKNSAKVLAKKFGLRHVVVQSIISLKSRSKWHLENTPGYKLYPELEQAVVQGKQDWLDELSQDYGIDFSDQLYYKRGGEIDYEDPDNWIGAGAETGRNHKTGRLEEYDPNDKWDLPPKRTQTQIVDDLHESRRVKAAYVAARQAEAEKKTEELKTKERLPKKRWAYAFRDTTTKESEKVAAIVRDPEGHLRSVGLEEEKTLSWADKNLFRREVKHRNSLFMDVD